MQKILVRFQWLGPAVVCFGVFTDWQTQLHVIHPQAEEIVRQISARLSFPVKVDEITRTVGVRGKGDEITYDYSIAAPLANLGGRQEVQGKDDRRSHSTTDPLTFDRRMRKTIVECRGK